MVSIRGAIKRERITREKFVDHKVYKYRTL